MANDPQLPAGATWGEPQPEAPKQLSPQPAPQPAPVTSLPEGATWGDEGTSGTSTQAYPPSNASRGGLASRRNAQAQPGITPEMRKTSPVNQGLVEGAKDFGLNHPIDTAVNVVKNTIKNAPETVWNALPPVELYNNVKKTLPIINSYEQARANGASIQDALQVASATGAHQDALVQTVLQRADEFKKNPTKESVRALVDATGAAAILFGGAGATSAIGETLAGAGAEAGETAAVANEATVPEEAAITATPKEQAISKAAQKSGISPGNASVDEELYAEIVPKAMEGGMRNSVDAALVNDDLEPINNTVSVRDLFNEMGNRYAARSQATFAAVEKATGVNPTSLKDIMASRADAIEQAAAAGDAEKAGNLEQLQLRDEERMTKAFNDAKAQNIDVDQARTDWNKSLRANEVSSAVRSSASGTMEKPIIDPNKITPRLQRLSDPMGMRPGKLTQLLGDESANFVVKNSEMARNAAERIKDWQPISAKGQQAFAKILGNNTIEKSNILGKVNAKIDWHGVLEDVGNLEPKARESMFGDELPKLRYYVARQAAKQTALSLLKTWGIGGLAAGGGFGIGKKIVDAVLP